MRYADGKYREKEYTVYMHKCPNNKVYIGITCQSPNGRWNEGEGYKTQKLFYRAIQKYGWDNIEHIILDKHLSLDEASCLEKKLIAEYKSNNTQFGYNLTNGGEGISGYHLTDEQLERHRQVSLGRKHSQATKDKISKLKKGKKLNLTDEQRAILAERAKNLPHYKKTEEQRKQMSLAYEKRRDKPGHAMPHSEEAKKKISEAQKCKIVSEEAKKNLSIAINEFWRKRKEPKNTNSLF